MPKSSLSDVSFANVTALGFTGPGAGLTDIPQSAVTGLATTLAGFATYPTQTGNAGKVLTTDGTNVAWTTVSGGGGGGAGTEKTYNQTAHGFVVGDTLYFDGANFSKAQANAAATSEVLGMVSAVPNADSFVMASAGFITGLSGLTAGQVYFLDAATAGALTATEPTAAGTFSKPVLVALSATSGLIKIMRGVDNNSPTNTPHQHVIADITNLGRVTFQCQTGTLAPGSLQQIVMTPALKLGTLLKLSVDYPARVRIYGMSAAQGADASRSEAVDPTGNHGLLAEVIFASPVLSYVMSPMPTLANFDTPSSSTLYVTVTNRDGVSRAITVTFEALRLEA